MKKIICHLAFGVFFFLLFIAVVDEVGHASDENDATYVGSDACKECHEVEFENFKAYARKATSYKSIVKMQKGLTAEEVKGCFTCHTTGYGQPGGFVSIEQTPHLKNAGCEVCHGPGSNHIESEDPEDIITDIDVESCKICHNSSRVEAFNFKPMLHGGAH